MSIRVILFIITIFHVVKPSGVRFIQKTPVSSSMKTVLKVMGTEHMQNISCAHEGVLLIKQLQQKVKGILSSKFVSVADIQSLEDIIKQMKLHIIEQTEKDHRSHQLLQELCVDAAHLIDTVSIGAVDKDIQYIHSMLLEQCHNDMIDRKVSLRILAIVEEYLRRYDGIMVSAHTALALSQVAVIVFVMNIV